ncbi:FG-GAP-like repeat-containing protein [uncultured Thiobacillus sp.]|uniref:FG-GAP-like repeat-containing protein n=2 Tax=Thiobacillus TaxID=919 RepID=UPI002613AA71|nr:FG-GAP-like repeat-containing protein [uncultured Thiobacillus sp.]
MSFSFAVYRPLLGRVFERIIALFGLIVLIPASFAPSAYATAVGATPGSHQVSPSGAFTYTIPIAVPPGTAGIEPKLSLSYNSQGGNGLLGMGWSLAGLSVIHRCPKTMIQDGVIGGVNYNANDRYCLDGQRLVAISGTYGADATEYRTESESYSRIVSYGSQGSGPAWWKVWTKSGQILEYGNTADSRIEAQGKTEVMLWSLNKLQDTVGNYLTISYIEDTPNGQYYPDRIDYTGNGNAGKTPGNSVRFVYEARPDITPLFQAGSLNKTTVRLTSVQTYADTALIKEYRLAYEQSSANKNSRITGLMECSEQCINATSFSWQNLVPVLGSWTWTGSPVFGFRTIKWLIGDFNGDGKTDIAVTSTNGDILMRLSAGVGGFVQQTWVGTSNWDWWSSGGVTWTGDFDGDGKTDIASASGGNVLILLSTGRGFNNRTWAVPNAWGGAGYTWVGDFNGDGKTDIASANGGSVYVHLSTGSGFDNQTWAVPNAWGGAGYTWVGDFNGDGKTDIASANGGSVYVHLSTGSGFDNQTWAVPNAWGGSDYTWVGDFNGDGNTGIVSLAGFNFYTYESIEAGTFGKLASITTGLGTSTTVTYKPLTDNSVYTKDAGAVYPYVDVQAPLYVVSSVATSDGLGGTYSTYYSYAGAKSHLLGGGFLGFRQVSVHDPQAHIRSTTTYRQDYPYQGQPLSTQKRTNGGILLGQNLITYTDQLLNTGISPTWHQSLPTHTVESSYELTGGLISTVVTDTQYDAWGNPTAIAVDSGGGYNKTTTNTYDNIIDANRWFLGRLRRSTVTSVTP